MRDRPSRKAACRAASVTLVLVGLAGCGPEVRRGDDVTTTTSSSSLPSPTILITDEGACDVGVGEPLEHELLYTSDPNTVFELVGLLDGPTIVTDQASWQAFEDAGLPPVDFGVDAVLLVSSTDGTSCGGDVPWTDLTVTLAAGAPHLDITWWHADQQTPDGYCAQCNLVGMTVLAVRIAQPEATPTFCAHVVTGC